MFPEKNYCGDSFQHTEPPQPNRRMYWFYNDVRIFFLSVIKQSLQSSTSPVVVSGNRFIHLSNSRSILDFFFLTVFFKIEKIRNKRKSSRTHERFLLISIRYFRYNSSLRIIAKWSLNTYAGKPKRGGLFKQFRTDYFTTIRLEVRRMSYRMAVEKNVTVGVFSYRRLMFNLLRGLRGRSPRLNSNWKEKKATAARKEKRIIGNHRFRTIIQMAAKGSPVRVCP